MGKRRIWWHPAFYAAMQMKFLEDKDNLVYSEEIPLSHRPLVMDMMIIEKQTDQKLHNEIGLMFRKYNVIEYKSPKDKMNIDTFYKVQAYAAFYKAKYANDIQRADEISVTMIRMSYPRHLFQDFKKQGFEVHKVRNGIYYIEGNMLFPTQMIVVRQLEFEKHMWVRTLGVELTRERYFELLRKIYALKDAKEYELADSMLQVVTKKNEAAIMKWKEEDVMCEALQKIMKPELDEKWNLGLMQGISQGISQGIERGRESGRKEGLERGREEGLTALVNTLKEFFDNPEDILERIHRNEDYRDVTLEKVLLILNAM